MRLIDADKLSPKIETMYLGNDTKDSHRVCAETEDTMIGKFQVIDTIFEMPTVDVNGMIIAEFEKIKAEMLMELYVKRATKEALINIVDNHISKLKGENK